MKKSYIESFWLIDRAQKEYVCAVCIYELAEAKKLWDRKDIWADEDKKVFDSMKSDKSRISYMLGRVCAKRAVAELLPQDMSKIWIQNGIFGQPIMDNSGMKVSITHTDSMGAGIAFSGHLLMGIDLEKIDIKRFHVLECIISLKERALIRKFVKKEIDVLITIWTVREALGKAICTGITIPEHLVEIEEVMLEEDGSLKSLFKNFPQYQAKSWIGKENVMTIVFPANTDWKGYLDCKEINL